MSGHIYSKEGTAAVSPGVTIDILGDAAFTAKQVLVQNTHASLVLTIAGMPTINSITVAPGQALLIPGSVQRFRCVEATSACTFKVLASDSSAPAAEVIDLLAATGDIANGAVTAAKLAAGAVTAAKLDAGGTAAAGSVSPAMTGFARVVDGANEIELVLPVKCVLAYAGVAKTGGAGGAGDEIQLWTATGGAGTQVAGWSFAAASDGDYITAPGIDDAGSTFAAGASIFVLGVAGAGDNGGDVYLSFAPID
jgi:hypothetical protein